MIINLFVVHKKLCYNNPKWRRELMDWSFCGLIDLILVAGALIMILVGFKKGFINKMLSLVGILAIIIFAIFYCTTIAQFMIQHNIIYPSIYGKFYSNVSSKLNITEETTATEAMQAALGVPTFIANLVAKGLGDPDPSELAAAVCQKAATWIMNAIAFGIIVVASLILLVILKAIAKGVRTVLVVKIVDGILGMVLYAAIYFAIVTAIFALLHIFVEKGTFGAQATQWLRTDMALDIEGKFRLSKTLYNQNFFIKIYNLFFGK